MIITKITIQNFGTHQDTVLELNQDILAIYGPNGAGKTYLIEAVPACLFGTWPSRGNLTDGITQGFSGDAYLRIDFQLNDCVYCAERKVRKTAKTVTQEAFLSMEYESTQKNIAGPKVADFEQAIKNLLGDPKVFFASAFSSQGNHGDIVECKPTERKRVLAELLELNKYQEKSESFGQTSRDLEIRNGEVSQKISSLKEMRIDPLLGIEQGICDQENPVAFLENSITSSRAALEQMKKTRDDAQVNLQELTKRRAAINLELEKKKLIADEYTKLDNKREQIARDITLLEQAVENLPELKDKQAARLKVIDENQKVSEANAVVQKEIDAARLKLTDYEREKSRLDGFRQQACILDSGNFDHAPCRKCRFLSSANLAKQQMDSIKLPPQDQVTEWTRISRQSLMRLKPLPEDVSEALRKAQSASDNIAYLEKEKKETIIRLVELNNKLRLVPDYAAEIELLNTKYVSENEQIQGLNFKIDEIGESINKNTQIITRITERQEQNKKIDAQIADSEKSYESNVLNEKTYSYLRTAFGRKGIQALLIDEAIPQLQAISDDLLQSATDGRMQIDFSTQRELKTGGTSESLEILCTDEKGTRDVSHFSGGEQKILRSIIRLTLAIFQSQRSSMKLQTLIIDEAFDALDQENSANLLKVLEKVKSHFQKVVFISHNEEMLTDFPNKVSLIKRNGVSNVC